MCSVEVGQCVCVHRSAVLLALKYVVVSELIVLWLCVFGTCVMMFSCCCPLLWSVILRMCEQWVLWAGLALRCCCVVRSPEAEGITPRWLWGCKHQRCPARSHIIICFISGHVNILFWSVQLCDGCFCLQIFWFSLICYVWAVFVLCVCVYYDCLYSNHCVYVTAWFTVHHIKLLCFCFTVYSAAPLAHCQSEAVCWWSSVFYQYYVQEVRKCLDSRTHHDVESYSW